MNTKHVVIAVTGGIACYKACDLVSQLSKRGYEIKVIETKNAMEFVPPLTFETLSHNPVETSLFDSTNEDPIAHISLQKWADLFVLVPATANAIAKIAHGIADDLVSTAALACTCDMLVCPAMNVHMLENPATQTNLEILKSRGIHILEPAVGHLACDDIGKGKLPPVSEIADCIDSFFTPKEKPLAGKTVLISAGPTQEALDPVRFISNHSSGKQGYAIAQAAIEQGANVLLVSGPVSIEPPKEANLIQVKSAQDMFEAVTSHADQADFIIMAAAVADYRPEHIAEHKIKKSGDSMEIKMVRNPDILAWLGTHKKPGQVLCGFAMETQDLEENARKKLEAKNCDMLIANNLFVKGAGFQTDTNIASLLLKDQTIQLEKCTKKELGEKILETMLQLEKETLSCF
jgi:phosphopantothenoylcysteine decarboxylase/phosphopantothenate--cysteine ligase